MSTPPPPRHAAPPGFAPHLEFTVAHGEREERLVISTATAAAADALELAAEAWLTAKERDRIARAVAKRRREFMLGRYAAKTALAVWNRRPAVTAFAIEPGAFEQPVVIGDSAADVTLAHTADTAVAAAHERGHPLGVDLETVDVERIEVVRTQVAATELPPPGGALASEAVRLFLLWSAKEALSKALRCGLTCPFELLATSEARIDDRGVCAGAFANFGQYQFVAWLLGERTFALVCSRNARLEPILPALVRFTRESTGVRP